MECSMDAQMDDVAVNSANTVASPNISTVSGKNTMNAIEDIVVFDNPPPQPSAAGNAIAVAAPIEAIVLPQKAGHDTCMECLQSEPRYKFKRSNFVSCSTCAKKWHYNCVPVMYENRTHFRKRFKCESCRFCFVCKNKRQVATKLLMCSVCVKVFHVECQKTGTVVHPTLVEPEMASKWKCNTCNPAITLMRPDEAPPKVRLPLLPRRARAIRKRLDMSVSAKAFRNGKAKASTSKIGIETEAEDKRIHFPVPASPDKLLMKPVPDWSIDEVVSYVKQLYPKEAELFSFHEIDGTALMLLSRLDIINYFKLTLGKALCIYQLVQRLQETVNSA